MKIPYAIIRSWTKFKGTPEELRSLIDLHITEVEAIIETGKFARMVVGEILEIAPHPNADKLQITRTSVGDAVLQIVCGAKNIKVGQKVPVALSGSFVAGDKAITNATIRGVDSFGMLCSSTELGFTDESEGILLLDSEYAPGTPLGQIFDEDTGIALDLKVLADRPDYMSYLSIAREVAASMGEDFTYQLATNFSETRKQQTKNLITVKQHLKADLCARYIAKAVTGLTVEPSPDWLQSSLKAVGLRPVNNLVDAANLVMLETGQPIHVFDLAKIKGGINIRNAKNGEELVCLDDATRKLTSDDIVIADSKKPIAIAGIIGGKDSGVSETTKDIIIEVANFSRKSIRLSAKRLGVRTDASSRFERGVDLHVADLALARLLNLLQSLVPNSQVATGSIDLHELLPPKRRDLSFDLESIKQLVDIKLTNAQIQKILAHLDLPAEINGKTIRVSVPSYRQDIADSADIAEEIIRIHGLDQIASVMPQVPLQPVITPQILQLADRIRSILSRLGLTEVKTHPFISGDSKTMVAIENPLNENWTHLKSNLLTSLLQGEHESRQLFIYEINKVFTKTKADLPTETTQLAVRMDGAGSYLALRSLLATLCQALGVKDDYRELPTGKGLELVVGSQSVGEVIWHSGNSSGLFVNLDSILGHIVWATPFVELPKYPSIKFDLAFEIDNGIRIGQMHDAIIAANDLVIGAELFDVFELSANHRSTAFHIELRSYERTLTKEDREAVQAQIIEKLSKQFQAKLRG